MKKIPLLLCLLIFSLPFFAQQVAPKPGPEDTKAFRSIFKKMTGLTPIEYRNKYNKMAQQKVGVL